MGYHPEQALLYESDQHTGRHCQDTAQGWPVPAGSFAVTDSAHTWLAPRTGGGGGPALQVLFDFTCVPVRLEQLGEGFVSVQQVAVGEGGVAPEEQLYKVCGDGMEGGCVLCGWF